MVANISGYRFELWYALLFCNFIRSLILCVQQCRYPGHEQFKYDMVKHELRVTICELRVTSHELKA